MRTEISSLHKNLGATMIYVTHDQTEAMTMGNKIVVLKDGIVQQIGKPMEIYNQPVNKFVAGFIGSPAMNFISGKVINPGGLKFRSDNNDFEFDLSKENFTILQKFIDKRVSVGIRPENIVMENLNNTIPVTVKADLIETMGNESFLYFKLNGKQLIARLNPFDNIKPDEEITLYFKKDKLFFFDEISESSLVL